MAIKRLMTLGIGFSLWELLSLMARTKNFPHAWVIASDLARLVSTPAFWSSLAITLWLSLVGLVFGTFLAFAFGVPIGISKHGDASTRGVLNFMRCLPSVVLLPLFVSTIGSSAMTAVILTVFVVSFKLSLFVIRGVRDTNPQLLESAAAMRMSSILRIYYIYLPSIISIVGTGLRLSASRAFGTVVAAGIVAGTPGLGLNLYLAEATAQYSRVFSYVFVMGVVGSIIYSVFTFAERRLFAWRVTT